MSNDIRDKILNSFRHDVLCSKCDGPIEINRTTAICWKCDILEHLAVSIEWIKTLILEISYKTGITRSQLTLPGGNIVSAETIRKAASDFIKHYVNTNKPPKKQPRKTTQRKSTRRK